MSDLVVSRNCCMTRMLPGEAELVSVYKNIPFFNQSLIIAEMTQRPKLLELVFLKCSF